MSYANHDGWIWLDGKYLPWKDAKVHVLTHTLHYGLGVFEGVRAYQTAQGPALFRLQDHTQRLLDSAKIVGLDLAFDAASLNQAQCDIVRKNQLNNAYLRPMCFYGDESLGLHAPNLSVHMMIAAWDWGVYLGEEKMQRGLRVKTSTFRRHSLNSSLCRAKTNGNYVNSLLALKEAGRCGYDEALMLDADGFVSEGSCENFFMVKAGCLFTPTLRSALSGITRRSIMTLAQEMGLEVVEANLSRDDVYTADEAFFTGTAIEVMPICTLDHVDIGQGKPGPITLDLKNRYEACTRGQSETHPEWLTHV